MLQIVPKSTLKGLISYCGPVDLKQTISQKVESQAMKFFINTVAWSLTGVKNWKNSPAIEQASLVSQLTADYPATYITDGNTFSFQAQGIAFYERLQQLGVYTEGLFFDANPEPINHEYQFEFQTAEAKDNLDKTISFINTILK